MISRMLLYVEDTPGLGRAAAWTLGLAQTLSCRVFALAVIGPAQPRKRLSTTSNIEERAWELLYEIEDDAFGKNVRVSLLLEPGEPLTRLLDLISSYEIDLIVASADTRLPVPELVKRSPRPVVLAR
jgi:nucleotide-binding universal stress UspA family protein